MTLTPYSPKAAERSSMVSTALRSYCPLINIHDMISLGWHYPTLPVFRLPDCRTLQYWNASVAISATNFCAANASNRFLKHSPMYQYT